MHDLHLADKIHRLILEKARENELNKIILIVIEIGFIEEHGEDVSAENLKFNLKMLNENSIAKDAEIKIKKLKRRSGYWQLKEIIAE